VLRTISIKLLFLVFFLGYACSAYAEGAGFVKNEGQWHENVLYRTELPGAYGFIDRDGISILQLDEESFEKFHSRNIKPEASRAHLVRMRFVGGSLDEQIHEYGDHGYPKHYLRGNDSNLWVTNVRTHNRLRVHNVYPGIDAHFQSAKRTLKYDFEVSPGSDPDQIRIEIDGASSLEIIGHALNISTSVGGFKELAPFAYQLGPNGRVEQVECHFILEGNELSYSFPDGWDTSRKLIIDPEIAFSTFAGSGSDTFGFTASYDSEGNLYGGAIVFDPGYPTTAGAFQVTFGNGDVDCGITKFSADGSELLYSTYLGGSGGETPHSIVTNEDGELYIFGATSSLDFPISSGAYQPNFAGGNTVEDIVDFPQGTDIFVTRLSADGSTIIGSTYVGGSENDGLNGQSEFDFNYADQFRGEIVLDSNGNAYVASVSRSSDFPIVNGYSTNFTGVLSGVVFKLNASLEDMIWSTFTGGSGNEVAFSLQLAPDNSVYFTGGTASPNIPVSANAYQSDYMGEIDGYVGHISANGSELLHCTYNGTNEYDQNYFVQLDTEGNVYVVGQTLGDYPVVGNVYSNNFGKQFIHKFSPDLSTTEWSTTIGSLNAQINFTPSAFLVSNCGQIYISGWGGILSGSGTNTTMLGLPLTDDAFQSTSDGNDFYIMVLAPDATDLVYATYFGGTGVGEHVDGGTSRFDKNGTIYQAVCAGCGGSSDFPTTPGVWSQTNPSPNCNLGVFKFELSSVNAIAQIDGPDAICPGTSFDLVNLSQGSDTYTWEFSDGNSSNEESLSYSFDSPGTYEIELFAESSDACINPDSTTLIIVVEEPAAITAETPEPVCPGEPMQLQASGNVDSWEWFPANNISNPTIANPIFTGSNTTILNVVGFTDCSSDTAQVVATIGSVDVAVSEDISVCPGESTTLTASGGVSYQWSPSETLDDTDIPDPVASPVEETTYEVIITTSDGCEITESVTVSILPPPPIIQGDTEYVSCNGSAVLLEVEGADTWAWEPPTGLSQTNISNPVAQPAVTTTYTATGSNVCGEDQLEVTVFINEISVSVEHDSLVCYNTPFQIRASGGDTYRWEPRSIFGSQEDSEVTAIILNSNTQMSVTAFDAQGCRDTKTFTVRLFPRPQINAGRDRVISYGESTRLEPFSFLPITWEDSPYLSCLECNFPIADPLETTTFYATIESEFGCLEVDSATVFVRGDIYVPNAFTPDGDGLNDIFKAKGVDIVEFKMQIFNRWGELIFESSDMEVGWNGGAQDSEYFSPTGLYPYIIVAREKQGDLFELKGSVQLIR
jgi:gliding motility-associated-like protein